MEARRVVRGGGAIALALLLALSPGGAATDPEDAAAGESGGSTRPNVLVIVTDDQRAVGKTMTVMSETRSRIGDLGREFRRSFATTPLCCPSRASILTGQYVHNHTVIDNFKAHRLRARQTIPFHLKEAGYSTAIFGKFLNLWSEPPPYFDRWAIPNTEHTPAYENEHWNVDGLWQFVPDYSTDWLGDRTVEHLQDLEADDERPWFTYVAPLAPHAPYTPADRHEAAEFEAFKGNPAVFEKDRSDKPPYLRKMKLDFAFVQEIAERQKMSLLAVDELVARLDETLAELGERGNTLVLFLSDNGYTWGEHGLIGATTSKNSPYTASVRIPMMMRWPGRVGAGSQEGRFATNVDVAPTIYDAAGISSDVTHEVDGRSLLDRSWKRPRLFLERFNNRGYIEMPGWASLRTREWQYVEYYDEDRDVSFREYYDLERDPWQLRNLFHDDRRGNEPHAGWLRERLQEARHCTGTTGARACP